MAKSKSKQIVITTEDVLRGNAKTVDGWFHFTQTYEPNTNPKKYINGERHYVGLKPMSQWPDWMIRNLGVR